MSPLLLAPADWLAVLSGALRGARTVINSNGDATPTLDAILSDFEADEARVFAELEKSERST